MLDGLMLKLRGGSVHAVARRCVLEHLGEDEDSERSLELQSTWAFGRRVWVRVGPTRAEATTIRETVPDGSTLIGNTGHRLMLVDLGMGRVVRTLGEQ